MVIRIYGILLLLIIVTGCAKPILTSKGQKQAGRKLQVFSNFERGAIGDVKYVSSDTVVVNAKHWKKRDNIGDQYYWFYFALSRVKNKKVTVQLDQLTGIYRGNKHEVYTNHTYPVFSYNQTDWQRIPQVQYNEEKKSFTFTHRFDQDTVWLAYAHPYPLSRLQTLQEQFKENSHLRVTSLGNSQEGRSLNLFSVSDYSQPEAAKKVAVIIALQHSGEDVGGYVAEGLIRYLMTDNEAAREIRKNWLVHVVPVMNPDGVYRGITRYNANHEDLNSIWLRSADSLQSGPEVKAARQWLDQQFQLANAPDVFFDIHSHTQQIAANHMFSTNPKFEAVAQQAAQTGFPLKFTVRKSSTGASQVYLDQKYKIPAALIELTQSYVNDKQYIRIEDLSKYGEALIKGIHATF
jgi:hypothetical protein